MPIRVAAQKSCVGPNSQIVVYYLKNGNKIFFFSLVTTKIPSSSGSNSNGNSNSNAQTASQTGTGSTTTPEVCTNDCSDDCEFTIGVCCQLVDGTKCTYKCLGNTSTSNCITNVTITSGNGNDDNTASGGVTGTGSTTTSSSMMTSTTTPYVLSGGIFFLISYFRQKPRFSTTSIM